MKNLLLGILFIIAVGIGGFVYRNAVEHPTRPIACSLDTKSCPDGTSVSRSGASCAFPACPPPNVSIAQGSISFAVPADFESVTRPDATSVAAYVGPGNASTSEARIIVRQYAVTASSSPSAVIRETAIGGASGAPVPDAAITSVEIRGRQYTVAAIERFEGVVDTAYYLVHETSVFRFDAIDSGVVGWTDERLDVSKLPARFALTKLLATLQVL